MILLQLWDQRHWYFHFFMPLVAVTLRPHFLEREKSLHGKPGVFSTKVTATFTKLSSTPESVCCEDLQILEEYVVLLYDRSSSCTGVSEARLDLFARKQRAYDSIPTTNGALKEHVKRAAFQVGHIWNQSHSCPVQEIGDGRKLMVHGYPTGQSWQLSPNRVKN